MLILDEPTAGLDAASAQRLLAVIRRFAASHTVILITHDPRLIAAADRVVHLAPAMIRPSALARSRGAGVTADAAVRAAARIVDRYVPYL